MQKFDIEFEIKKEIKIPNWTFKKGQLIFKGNNSHIITIEFIDSYNQKLTIPYVFGADYNGMCKPISEARKDCKLFVDELIKLNNNEN